MDQALRAVAQNFTQLSAAADHKASIVIGSTLLILGLLAGSVRSGPAPLAAYVMGGFTLLSCLFALLAVLPRVDWNRGQRSPGRVSNPFFFGDFDTISCDDYLKAMAGVLASDANLYRTVAVNLYQQGCVLQRKYRYLRYSYQILFIGLVAASIALITGYIL
ncbi:MAG: DUF5706 domain-containing protein [Pseudomonadota bacterium]|nr:DUF5706 domain-containing protein [Pseudomonadota bacterium]